MFWQPQRDDAVALRLEDLASTLDAGLQPPAEASSLELDPGEQMVLTAAQTSGTVPAAARSLAASRRLRADMGRELRDRLRYPMVLLAVTGLLAMFSGMWLAIGVAVGAIWAAYIGRAWLKASVRRPDFSGRWLPGAEALLRDAAEVRYLQALAGLYAAGVPILDAHRQATGTVAVGFVHASLKGAEEHLSTTGAPLIESLAQHGALCGESIEILQNAELAGQLEDALHRALARRRTTLTRRTGAIIRWTGNIAYAAAALIVALFVVRFYSGLYGAIGG